MRLPWAEGPKLARAEAASREPLRTSLVVLHVPTEQCELHVSNLTTGGYFRRARFEDECPNYFTNHLNYSELKVGNSEPCSESRISGEATETELLVSWTDVDGTKHS